MEALEIYETHKEEEKQAKLSKGAPPAPHPMMAAYQCDSAEDFVVETIRRIRARIHHGEITSNHSNLPIIERLKQHSVSAIKQHRDLAAFNVAGLAFLSKHIEETSGVMMFADATAKRKKKKRAVLTLK
ncbi:WD repeat-containing protein 3-like [Plakobranchus ocellatus]|uniref:WD repeat-containing protein 3-like n=1 Tax=Plakobranchus ocellatus TaxID=259542 RepID=A0AAV3YLL2_9GAST|nr:WD repeat-containing protein 3-like [Plakobranchus ocellatus]